MDVTSEEVSKKRAAPETAEEIQEGATQTKKAKTALDLFREQLEYYFSIANYPTDKWMNLTAAENGGCTFKREQSVLARVLLCKHRRSALFDQFG